MINRQIMEVSTFKHLREFIKPRPCVFATESVSVTEGDSVSLSVNLTEEQRGNTIMWSFGPKEVTIAEMNVNENDTSSFDKERLDGRFRDRLKLDVQSVSLIITHIRITDSGLYNITISGQEKPLKRFNITVYVMNVSHVSLSWYKGKSLLSNISVSEHSNINISLHLECLDDSYTCVINNPITNQTQHLNISHVCQPCSGEIYCGCGFTEAVIRLVISALVGMAAVAVLVYEVRTINEQKMRS
ncbi:hypothetical protein E1301_Tti013470 [Triplophysa tibetana]|uniref:Immunoglobulin domain-containing protein n=1 Tax=Triplophysa tibetana TaxID=1572043 RepID=A0A5A9NS22_9TELE|nr:hypothetical protein E1301_Tti013470 [Triplophysa tibetana]